MGLAESRNGPVNQRRTIAKTIGSERLARSDQCGEFEDTLIQASGSDDKAVGRGQNCTNRKTSQTWLAGRTRNVGCFGKE